MGVESETINNCGLTPFGLKVGKSAQTLRGFCRRMIVGE